MKKKLIDNFKIPKNWNMKQAVKRANDILKSEEFAKICAAQPLKKQYCDYGFKQIAKRIKNKVLELLTNPKKNIVKKKYDYPRPRLHLPKYSDYPIASTPIIPGRKKYDYPLGVKVLYEWEEKGHRWIVFKRKIIN